MIIITNYDNYLKKYKLFDLTYIIFNSRIKYRKFLFRAAINLRMNCLGTIFSCRFKWTGLYFKKRNGCSCSSLLWFISKKRFQQKSWFPRARITIARIFAPIFFNFSVATCDIIFSFERIMCNLPLQRFLS